MSTVIRIAIAIIIFLFGFAMFLDDSKRKIYDKLTIQEKRYFDRLEISFQISIWSFIAILICPIFE